MSAAPQATACEKAPTPRRPALVLPRRGKAEQRSNGRRRGGEAPLEARADAGHTRRPAGLLQATVALPFPAAALEWAEKADDDDDDDDATAW
jgi:hypothetical protein